MLDRYINTIGNLHIEIVVIIAIITYLIWHFITRRFKDKRAKWLLLSLYTGIFFYSGWGIAYQNVPDTYIIVYTVFIFTFGLPFLIFKKFNPDKKKHLCRFDRALMRNEQTLENIAVIYLLLNMLPLLYPELRLFDIISFKTQSIHVLRDEQNNNALISFSNLLCVLIAPYFYAFFTVKQQVHPESKKPAIFFLLLLLLQFGRFNYIARNEMIVDLANFIVLLFCVKGFKYKISWKVVATGLGVVIAMMPLLYLYTFFRMGLSYSGNISFSDMADLLIKSEFFYPIFYDGIIKNANRFSESLIDFISYLVCLPFPSAILPNKPSYEGITDFTYVFAGVERGDTGFFILLPSIIGESLIYGGKYFFWIFSLISGFIVSRIYRYLCTKKTLTYYTFFLIIYAFTYARGGTMGLMANLINGTLSIYLFDKFVRSTSISVSTKI